MQFPQKTFNKIKVCLVILGISLLCNQEGFNQATHYSFNHLTVKQGLSHGIVNAFCIDKSGFLWIATYNGVDRYDGSRFLTFKANRHNNRSLIHNSVHDICTDQEGNIWCLTEGGISRYNIKTGLFDNYIIYDKSTTKPLLPLNGAILCDRQGTIWCGNPQGLSEFDPATNKFINYYHKDNDSTTLSLKGVNKHDMVEDPTESKIWIASFNGINIFDTKTKIAYHAGNNPQKLPIFNTHLTYPICVTQKKEIVYVDNITYDICFFNTITHEFSSTKKIVLENKYNLPTQFSTMFSDSKNNLWISTWGYFIYRFNTNTGEVSEFFHDESDPTSINSTFAWDITEDKEGTLWFAGVNGVSYGNPRKNNYQLFRPSLQFPSIKMHQKINSIYEDRDGKIWFSAICAGLFSFDVATNKFENFLFEAPVKAIDESRNNVYSIIQIKDELWLGVKNGILKFNPKTQKFNKLEGIKELNAPSENVARFFTLESDSILWFYYTDDALYRYNLNTKTYQRFRDIFTDTKPLEKFYVSFVFVDSKKQVWFGLNLTHLVCYMPETKKFKWYKPNQEDSTAFPEIPTNTFVEDKKGNLWAPIKGVGIVRFNPEIEKVKLWNSSDGLVWDQCLAMIKDSSERLWISAYNQASVFDPSTNEFQNFNIEYANTNHAYFNRMISLKNGNLAWSLLDGIVVVEPEKHLVSLELPKVLISNFKVFEKPIMFSSTNPEINLSYKENYFNIDYSILTGVDPNNIQYQYKLEGFDDRWIEAGTRRNAAYTNVPGGDYVFKVKAKRGNGKWTETATSMNIHITKIFYQTWWFRMLLAMLMFAVIRLYFRFRENQLARKSEQEAINYFTHSQYTNSNPDEILWDLARNVISRLNFEDCVIYIYDSQKNVLVQKAGLDNKMKDDYSISNPLEIPLGKGIVGTVAANGKAEIIDDTTKDPRYIVDDENRRSEIAVPILHNEKVIGVIDSEHSKRNFFTNKHLQLLTTIASISADKIANAIARNELQDQERRLLEYDKNVAEVRLTALRAQMNPHFIFNCMNAIDNFILKNNTDAASRYLNKFARLIRSILTESDKKFISLKSEIEILSNYIELENLRFDEKFDYRIDINEAVDIHDTEIPPLLIQPFVENAIVHGLAHKQGVKKLSININISDHTLQCIIEDNGIGRKHAALIKKSKTVTHESKGMRITENRFELLQQQMSATGTVNVIDLYDDQQNAAGTRIEISIPIEVD